ncbi:transcriptional regulator [Planosporangium thailandense]|uniref:Transcriptional regulator n=1 Tax=Planosporangium thailandense TaxID=765197 RepID=A0ABX0Y714_9ACTN|nr:transcriptional regulator [Planosporangium thailandense]NJC73220.1 transcriptional regulator [Planosporangium thailandense]
MPDRDTPQEIVNRRTVGAEVVLGGIDLRWYPYRHLAVVSQRHFTTTGMSEILAAADVLAQSGWELVQVGEFGKGPLMCAIMRRL